MSEVPNPHMRTCEKCCNDKILRTSHTRENLNRKFQKCKGCRAFEWGDNQKSSESNEFRGKEDQNMSENKILVLLGEVRGWGIKWNACFLNFNYLKENFNEDDNTRMYYEKDNQVLL